MFLERVFLEMSAALGGQTAVLFSGENANAGAENARARRDVERDPTGTQLAISMYNPRCASSGADRRKE